MVTRIKFKPGNQKLFINQALLKNGLTVKKLAQKLNIHPRSLRDWRREKLNMPLQAVEYINTNYHILVPEDKNIAIDRWKNFKFNLSRKGGFTYYSKYGSPATKEGCIKGGRKTLSILRERGVIPFPNKYDCPQNLSVDLAEMVGILLGDGGMTRYQLSISLNSVDDKDYVNYVENLGYILFKHKPKLIYRGNTKCVDLYYNGENLIKYLISIGLGIGSKVKRQAGVPNWIESDPEYQKSCLKGLMDTDGGIHIHKYNVNGKTYFYKNVCFTNQSVPLIDFVYNTLKRVGLNPKKRIRIENKKVWLYNTKEVQEYLNLVGSSNQRLLKYRE